MFFVTSPNSASELNLNTGSFEGAWPSLKQDSEDFIRVAFDLQEIELISDDRVRIHIITDDVVIDTTVSYTVQDEEIVIEALSDSDLIYFDSEDDAFIVCGFTTASIPGPNTINPGPHFDFWSIEDCQEGADLMGHLNYVLDKYDYTALDTIGLLITKLIYK